MSTEVNSICIDQLGPPWSVVARAGLLTSPDVNGRYTMSSVAYISHIITYAVAPNNSTLYRTVSANTVTEGGLVRCCGFIHYPEVTLPMRLSHCFYFTRMCERGGEHWTLVYGISPSIAGRTLTQRRSSSLLPFWRTRF
jgi:hypothetical protein